MDSIEVEPFQFKHPFTCQMAGPSQSGKSTLMAAILQNNQSLITPAPTKILYCYSRRSDRFEQLKETVYPTMSLCEGLPDINVLNVEDNNLIILDDLMSQAEKSKNIEQLFTTDSHHANISVFLISQNMFSQGKFSRTISLNTHYMALFNNPRDRSQIGSMGRQMYPTNPHFLPEVYEKVTKNAYGYLFVDLTQTTDNDRRVQTNILSEEDRRIYQPINF